MLSDVEPPATKAHPDGLNAGAIARKAQRRQGGRGGVAPEHIRPRTSPRICEEDFSRGVRREALRRREMLDEHREEA